jgi:hypothetical protein
LPSFSNNLKLDRLIILLKFLVSKAQAAWVLIIMSPWRRGQAVPLKSRRHLTLLPSVGIQELSSDKYRHRKPDDLLYVTHHTLLILSSALFVINTLILVVVKIRYSTVGLCRWKRKRGRYSVEFMRHIMENWIWSEGALLPSLTRKIIAFHVSTNCVLYYKHFPASNQRGNRLCDVNL